MKYSLGLGVLLLTGSAAAADWPCAIHPAKNSLPATLPAMTKVAQSDAERTALAGFADFAAAASVADGELEVERNCLVYSFDIKVAGQPGIEEVVVDAGTGKVLARKHETAAHEAAEKRAENAAHAEHAKGT
jgi:hypothetical protein